MKLQDRQRHRVTGALFVGNALASTAFLAAISVASIAAAELAGSTRLAGVPSALGTAGSALGAYMLTALSRRTGRRSAFCLGLLISALGGAIAVSSLKVASFGALTIAMLVMGFGRSVTMLARFAAGEAQPVLLTVSLLLLGVGWNFSFVAASAALQEGLALNDRMRLQGLADSVTWTSGGVAALGSGIIMSAWSFPGLSYLAAGIALVPLLALGRPWRPAATV